MLRTEATKDPCAPRRSQVSSAAEGSFASLRMTRLVLRWLGTESNRRHADFQSAALPTELPSLKPFNLFELLGRCQRG